MGGTELAEGLMATGWNTGRPCDSCRLASAPASVFCRAHSAFLCLNCDAALHPHPTRHARVLICEVCEQAPAAFTCRADAASLCYDCDTDIHSANPLARRHERVAVEPFYDSSAEAIAKSTSGSCFKLEDLGIDINQSSTLLPPPPPPPPPPLGAHGVKSEEQLLFFPELSEPVSLLDFEFENLGAAATTDSLVPVQIKLPPGGGGRSIIDFSRANLSTQFDYVQPQSINHSVSSSSVDVGVVPDGSSMSDISFPCVHNMTHSGTGVVSNYPTLSSGTNSASSQSGGSNPCGMDREARVLRYREKRKNRKFEKTVRYASRKAYAEARPRIKGRFAKRIESDDDVGPIHHHPFIDPRSSTPFVGAAVQYGVVPAFLRSG